MKHLLLTFTLALGLAGRTHAAPPPSGQVPDGAKWVAHLDVDQLQKTRLGELLAKQFLDPAMSQVADEIESHLHLGVNWRQIHAITLYGTSVKKHPEDHTVVLVQSDLPLRDALKAVQAVPNPAAAGGAPPPFQRLEQDGREFYALGGQAFAALGDGNLLVLAKSRRAMSNAIVQLARKDRPAASTPGAQPPKGPGDAFLSCSLNESFTRGLELPPQAAILKQTDGARLSLAESEDQLLATLTVKAQTSEAAEQLHQALQGLMAVAALGTPDNPQLQQLLKAARVQPRDKEVDLALRYPVAELLRMIVPKTPKTAAAR
jgi:hypothetical protein